MGGDIVSDEELEDIKEAEIAVHWKKESL